MPGPVARKDDIDGRASNPYIDIPGGSGKAEGFADGEWANHRQAALAVATQSSAQADDVA
jgi:hypothetical protein